MENSAVVWHSSLKIADRVAIQHVQKVAIKIILNKNYEGYQEALELTGLASLDEEGNIVQEIC